MLSPSSELTCLRCTMSPLLPSSTIGTSFCSFPRASWVEGCKRNKSKKLICKKIYLPELVATTVEHSWSWPCGDTLNNIQYNGNPLQSLSILTRLFLCLETGSDDPVKRYELIIEIDCSILKLDCSIGWSLGNISDKNDPKKLRCDAGKLELL